MYSFHRKILGHSYHEACTQAEESKAKQDIESIVLSFEHPQTGQKFKIVNAYKLYQNYADKDEINPKQSQLEIYNEEVIKPVYSAVLRMVNILIWQMKF
ncbi:hypothetical protein [Lysinibacillus sphaericus]|uniref:hypothetical protein n=1 Tax=Lysinibacillus sphaericus TaxID=1421 RepID=UPI001F3993F8|nr:hypothetical protein [Lysinibacillus sphaericus]